ncbi:hypothetical protein GCK32_007932 [Trichostrongylus colubriformis]|uniref:C2H2-type domain-containing protein n=1 Tax=Trichostrongylus colubriformis TaxID=6319 RepID=A0AAN8FK58_TRICO
MSIKSEEAVSVVVKREVSPTCHVDSDGDEVYTRLSDYCSSPAKTESTDMAPFTHASNAVSDVCCNAPKASFRSDDMRSGEIKEPPPSVLCPACETKKGKKLYSHLFNMHGYTKAMIEQLKRSSAKVQCEICGSWHRSKGALRTHKGSFHRENLEIHKIQCPICEEEVQSHRLLARHAEVAHASYPGQYQVESLTFENREQYEYWRRQTEDINVLRWAANSVVKRGERKTTYYRCSRALPTPQYAVTSRPRSKKSTKYCTAFMQVTEHNETFDVLCCSDHAGHEEEPALLAFDQESESFIVSLLKEGLDVNQILEKVRSFCGENGQHRKLYHTTSWDISLEGGTAVPSLMWGMSGQMRGPHRRTGFSEWIRLEQKRSNLQGPMEVPSNGHETEQLPMVTRRYSLRPKKPKVIKDFD